MQNYSKFIENNSFYEKLKDFVCLSLLVAPPQSVDFEILPKFHWKTLCCLKSRTTESKLFFRSLSCKLFSVNLKYVSNEIESQLQVKFTVAS